MRYSLSNDELTIEVESLGAELKSVRSDNHEFMWQGDNKYWGRTSPVLFPFVGSLKDKQFRYKGKTYPMSQHGFARDLEHQLIEKTDNRLLFELRSTEETLARYPMEFVLNIGYELLGNSVKVTWTVSNPAQEDLHFSIGAHPGFNTPADKSGYRLYFEGLDEVHYHGNSQTTGLSLREDKVLKLENSRITMTSDFFDTYTYMIENRQTKAVGIEDDNGKMFVKVEFDMPLFALWSKEGANAPFICIEPWCGRCDAEDFAGELQEREYDNVLKKDEVFNSSYLMTFYK